MELVPMSKDQLIKVIGDMLAAIAKDDSFEGSIEYLMPYENDPDCDFMVRGVYRVGNSMGQGGVRLIGKV